jgi:hypothetical protein
MEPFMRLPPRLKWNKATDDLDYAAYHQWAREYEASLLPQGTIFPSPGQVWEAVHDCQVAVWICQEMSPPPKLLQGKPVTWPDLWSGIRSPFMTVPLARFPKGERARVAPIPDFSEFNGPKPLRACLRPLRYDQLQESLVPEMFRAQGYRGYFLHVPVARLQWILQKEIAYLNEDFRLVGDLC